MTTKYTNPQFIPSENGFKFSNTFDNALYFGPFDWSIRTSGRCGGMSYSALDYFHSHKSIPEITETPPDGDYIGDYILQRQFHTFSSVADEFITGTFAPGGGDMFYQRCHPSGGVDFNTFKKSIDQNKPCNLGLFSAQGGLQNIGNCHQVLGIGYTKHTQPEQSLIHIYDPNKPGKEMVLRLNSSKKTWEEYYFDPSEKQLGSHYKSWKAWFADTGYHQHNVPSDIPDRITDLSGKDLTHWNPPTEMLRNYRFVSSRFSGNNALNSCDFKGVIARNSLFDRTSAVKSSFLEADLSGTNFINANLRGSTFTHAILYKANFERTDLSDTDFAYCQGYSGASSTSKLNFSNAKFNNSNLTHAQMNASNFSYSSMANSKFRSARMRDSKFLFSALNNVNFSGTNNTDKTDMYSCDFRNASFKNCKLENTNLSRSDLSNVPISGCSFNSAECSRTKFVNSAIENTSMTDADVSYADFSGAALNKVDLSNVNFDGSKWRGASLKSCRMGPQMMSYILSHGGRF